MVATLLWYIDHIVIIGWQYFEFSTMVTFQNSPNIPRFPRTLHIQTISALPAFPAKWRNYRDLRSVTKLSVGNPGKVRVKRDMRGEFCNATDMVNNRMGWEINCFFLIQDRYFVFNVLFFVLHLSLFKLVDDLWLLKNHALYDARDGI